METPKNIKKINVWRLESNFYEEREKFYYLEFENVNTRDNKEIYLEVEKIDYLDEEEQIYILKEKSFYNLFEFLKSITNENNLINIECDEKISHSFEELNFIITIEYNNFNFKPELISLYIEDLNLILAFIY